MNRTSLFTLVTASLSSLGVLLSSCQQEVADQPQPVPGKYDLNFVPAKTNGEHQELIANKKFNLLRTPQDVSKLIASGKSPLSKLPQEVQQRFLAGITYRDGVGVTSLSFTALRGYLTYNEFAEVMSLFGLDIKEGYWGLSKNPAIIAQLGGSSYSQSVNSTAIDNEIAPTDYEGYGCIAPHYCTLRKDAICMSSCDRD